MSLTALTAALPVKSIHTLFRHGEGGLLATEAIKELHRYLPKTTHPQARRLIFTDDPALIAKHTGSFSKGSETGARFYSHAHAQTPHTDNPNIVYLDLAQLASLAKSPSEFKSLIKTFVAHEYLGHGSQMGRQEFPELAGTAGRRVLRLGGPTTKLRTATFVRTPHAIPKNYASTTEGHFNMRSKNEGQSDAAAALVAGNVDSEGALRPYMGGHYDIFKAFAKAVKSGDLDRIARGIQKNSGNPAFVAGTKYHGLSAQNPQGVIDRFNSYVTGYNTEPWLGAFQGFNPTEFYHPDMVI